MSANPVRTCGLTPEIRLFRLGVHDDEPVLSAAGPVSAVTAGACEVRFDALRVDVEDGL